MTQELLMAFLQDLEEYLKSLMTLLIVALTMKMLQSMLKKI